MTAMRFESNALPGSPSGAAAPEAASIPWWRMMVWSLRRELWENRSIYVAPAAVALATLIGSLASAVRLPGKIRASGSLSPMQLHDAIQQPYDLIAGLLMAPTLIVAVVYSLDALYGERRDRSVLFWKTLPVSDRITVLAKACVPILVLPLVGFLATVVAQLALAVVSSVTLAANGLSVSAYWEHLSFAHMSMLLLYHLVAVHGLSWAPFFGWMLLISAWTRRAPFVWAFLPLFAIGAVEHVAFNSSRFASMVGERLSGSESVTSTVPGHMPMNPMTTHVTAGRFFGAPGFWIGLVLTAVFLALAVRLRRAHRSN